MKTYIFFLLPQWLPLIIICLLIYMTKSRSSQDRLAFCCLSACLQYKYQILLDGTVAAYRFPYLLAGDSVILKQDSPYYEYFYKEVRLMAPVFVCSHTFIRVQFVSCLMYVIHTILNDSIE